MGALSGAKVEATVAVSDMSRAKAYFTDTLGLTQVAGEADFFAVFECGGTRLNVYPSSYVGSAKSTVATFVVSDLDSAMAALRQNGVVFEEYDMTDGPTTVDGVAEAGGVRSAWFKDPDGNTYAVAQVL
ncbi:MAG: VOC family protein [Candidatus Dormibacteraeota bacterium]|nr:VOC family protein [Candidatus Dormibacteraeota bacterium]